tara:strand:+ start:778 stop:1020 length:243 start_codon:yes stop_codon:yes gene_type:complete
MKKKVTAWLDKNDDGELTIEDISYIGGFGHEWMFIAGLAIAIGSIGNVLEYWSIDSDFFWFCAAIAAMSEYLDDVRKKTR